MSQNIESGDGRDHHQHRSLDSNALPSPLRQSQGESGGPCASDTSWPLFSIYSKIAEDEDDRLTERYQKVADGILIFSGLFSATIATSASVVFPDLRPNPQDTSTFYLSQIYQLLANPNISQLGEPITLATPPAFSPPLYAIVTNLLWLLSASCAVLSAALAMLLQEWTHRYLMVTRQPHFTPDQRARVREIFSNCASGRYVLWGTYPMTLFVHLSIFFYILGGLVYILNVNRAVFAFLFLCAMFVPSHVGYYTAASILEPGMLFYGPFSQPVLRICLGILYTVTQISSRISILRPLREASKTLYHDFCHFRVGFLKGKGKAVEQVASNDPTKVDLGVLELTLNNSVIDADLEKFFIAIPGFFDSKLVNNLQGLSNEFQNKLGRALDGFLDHTFSSRTFSESVRGDRLLICLNAARAALGPGAVSRILGNVFDGRWPATLQSIEVGHALRGWDDISVSSHIRRIVSRIISCVPVHERNDRWIALVKDEFGMPDRTFEGHVASGDGISLAVLIHITRQLLRTDVEVWEPGIFRGLSDFDIRNTLPEQQHDFCAVWNEVSQTGSTPVSILEELRRIHTFLHQDTDGTQVTCAGPAAASTSSGDIMLEPRSYPFCHVIDDRLDSTLHSDREPAEGTALPPPSDASSLHIPIHTSSRPAPLEGQSAVASPDVAAAEIPPVSHIAALVPHPILENGPARQQDQEAEIITSPVVQTDYLARIPLSSSSGPSIPPQISTIFGRAASATSTSFGNAGLHNDDPNPNPPTSTEAQSVPSALGLDESFVRREGHEHDPR